MENHVYRFKRTVPVNGVVCTGEGAFDTCKGDCPESSRISEQWLVIRKFGNSEILSTIGWRIRQQRC